ncbi:MAG: hypothetical protein ACD_73C00093G0001 [uncultured bacterium]|nr:MAG: hypothetical protein ACD_73C00093G0001 [uncultured bacterium]
MVFYKGLSSDFEIPEKVDVIISETVGSLGFNENILPYIIDARKRHLQDDGHIIPAQLSLFLAPTSHSIHLKQTKLNGAIQSAFHIEIIPASSLLCAEQLYFKADFKKTKNIGFDIEKKFIFLKSGTIYGMAGWTAIEWAPGISTNTSPFHTPTHWKQSYLPLEKPLSIKAGQEFLFRLRIGPDPENPLEALIEWGYKIMSPS